MIYKLASKDDIKLIASCHKSAFPNSFSSKLGLKYVEKMFEYYIVDQQYLVIICEDNGKCLGYLAGKHWTNKSLYGSSTGLVQFTFVAILLGIVKRPWLVFNNVIWKNPAFLLSNLERKFFKTLPKKVIVNENAIFGNYSTMGLVVIGVNPKYRGQGIAQQLMSKLEEISIELKCNDLHLKVEYNNTSAIRSYEKFGWKLIRQEGEELLYKKFLN